MSVLQKMTRFVGMLCLLSIVSCSAKLDPNLVIGESSLMCDLDCVVVTKGFIKEHANLFDELIRTKASLKMCQESR